MSNMNQEENLGIVKISDEVVSVIAGIAAEEINGVEDLQHLVGSNISQLLKGKKNLGKNVRVTLNEDYAIIDLNLSVEYGVKIPEVVGAVQENVKRTVETMTGLKVSSVNINVQSIFVPKTEKEDRKEN
ncbi:Asp23/Gls24 family envelope stress response protein [Clostridium sartagoforme]|uniref:Asp23/Gls24 family envelope stress response protein n=1 Tax=Clostridium sartagoforme TaxID=84031 RepID=A0A4V3RLP6_9CLOT|nr:MULTISPECIES: Asp23/Gls24 family envelope stress response protein [Clostridium]MBS5938954.1 Asp23/Gls24 family envelope stress response protein [Clostridium sp.]TGY44340.1 Asp23/Gls24 family envelope stress response protein [Clostridium sartagoforme]